MNQLVVNNEFDVIRIIFIPPLQGFLSSDACDKWSVRNMENLINSLWIKINDGIVVLVLDSSRGCIEMSGAYKSELELMRCHRKR